MIKENELRINNLVKYKKGHLAIIKGFRQEKGKNFIDVEGVEDNYINGTYETSNFYPVDLTPELIECCDFKFPFKGCYVEKTELSFNTVYHLIMFNLSVRLDSFHDMQNVYSSISKTELNYSLKQLKNG